MIYQVEFRLARIHNAVELIQIKHTEQEDFIRSLPPEEGHNEEAF